VNTVQPSKLAQSRADFIKRLFAVIVSVGFANQLIGMGWVKNYTFPGIDDLPHIIFLLLGLLLVIQSWEGYFSTLEDRPLETGGRFYVDTAIVFTYLLLLSVSNGTASFLAVICVIFFLYIVWDFLTFAEGYKPSSLIAFVYFLEIYGIYVQINGFSWAVYPIAAAVFLGLAAYRWDRTTRLIIAATVCGFLVLGCVWYLHMHHFCIS